MPRLIALLFLLVLLKLFGFEPTLSGCGTVCSSLGDSSSTSSC